MNRRFQPDLDPGLTWGARSHGFASSAPRRTGTTDPTHWGDTGGGLDSFTTFVGGAVDQQSSCLGLGAICGARIIYGERQTKSSYTCFGNLNKNT